MKILICGATGFVGRHLTESLKSAGHTVIRGIRNPTQPNDIAVDFSKDNNKEVWLPRLKDIDVVINAVGVLRHSKIQPMQLLHEQTPLALFAACKEAGVKRIVQGSALGVDKGIETAYFLTRRKAEQFLRDNFDMDSFTLRQAQDERINLNTVRAEPVEVRTSTDNTTQSRYLILRPSVIYGEDGASAKMFRLQASLPVHFLPAGGKQKLQPVHIDDICAAVVNWLADDKAISQTVTCVGAEATDMRGMLDSYRQQLGEGEALHISTPALLVSFSAILGDFIPASPLCSDTLLMLNAGNVGDPIGFAKLLSRQPRSYQTFISASHHAHR